MSYKEYWEPPNISVNISVAILSENTYWLVDPGLMYGRQWAEPDCV